MAGRQQSARSGELAAANGRAVTLKRRKGSLMGHRQAP